MQSRHAWPWRLVLWMLVLAVIAPGGLSKPEPDPGEPPVLDWPQEPPILPTEPVGYLPVSTSVGPTGEYRISVPLDVPPGIAGMAPSLALSYGSEGGDDIAGVGWSLSGTSILQRCAATPASDGYADGVDFIDDRFCLDGAKLVAVVGKYGAMGTEYRTERDPFAKIVSSGDSGLGPEKFTVHHRDGRVSTYSPFDTVQAPYHFAYLLTETYDQNGNAIHYDYAVDDQIEERGGLSILLLDITYTHRGLIDGRRQVIFHYQDRPDPSFAYIAGVRTRRDKRLSAVEMLAPNPVWTEKVWEYELRYDTSPDTGRSLLQGIRKRDAKDQSLWEKQFEWAHHTRPSFERTTLPEELDEPGYTAWWNTRVLPIDLDGDGKDEVLYQLDRGADDQAMLRRTLDPGQLLQGARYFYEHFSARFAEGRPLDREADGRMEVLARDMGFSGGWYRIYRWDPATGGFTADLDLGVAPMNPPVVVDFDGLGWSDALYVPDHSGSEDVNWQFALAGPNGFSPAVDTGLGSLFGSEVAGDIDGDGRGDVMVADWSNKPTLAPPGYYPDHTKVIRVEDDGTVIADDHWDLGDPRHIVLADVNGDGLKDAVNLSGRPDGTPVRFNRGEGFGPEVLLDGAIAYLSTDKPGVRVADFDRDGAEDFLVFRDDGFAPEMAVYLSRPGRFEEVVLDYQPHPTESGSWETLKVGDFNGDGLPDIVDLVRDATDEDHLANAHFELLIQTPGESDVIIAIRDEQAPIPRERVSYTRERDRVEGDDACGFPQRCLSRGMRLVDEVDTYRQDSLVPQTRARYRFAGGRSDVLGRGFLGYSRVIVDDLDSHARTVTTYDNATRNGTIYPFAGLPTTTETITPILSQNGSVGGVLTSPGNTAVARVRRVESAYLTSWQYDHRAYFVHPSRSVETEWEQPCSLSGPAVELLGDAPPAARTVRRIFAFDEYGNPTFQSHATERGVHGETTQIFENRTVDDWHLGLLRESYVTEGEPNSSPPARVTFQDYDGRGNLRHVVREPFEPALQQEITYKRDDRGLVTKVTRSAPGLVGRRTYLFYDEEGVFVNATENELGHTVQTLTHPALGVPVTTRDENGVETHFTYDGFGRIRRVEPDGGIATEIHYSAWGDANDIWGLHTTATSADGSAAYRRTDRFGRPREEATLGFDGTWSVSVTNYTVYGQRYLQSRPGVGAPGAVTLTQHDTLGRVQWAQAPDGAVISFDYELFRTKSTDPKGRVHETDLDRDGRPAETREYGDDGHAIPVCYRYGDFGLLERVADGSGHATLLSYDKLGRRTSVTDPDRGQAHVEYSGFDEPSRVWDVLHDVSYERDLLGRVTRKLDTHGSPAVTEATTFEYDDGTGAIGRLTQATSPDGVVTGLSYNALGQPVSTKWTIDGEVFEIEQTYGPGGRPDQVRYPKAPVRDRFFIKLGYNERGYLDTVARNTDLRAKPFWQVLGRGADGRLTQAEWQDGPVETRVYDSVSGRLGGVRIDGKEPYGQSPLLDLSYTYEAGELATRTDAVTGRHEAFDYDGLDRLKKWTLSGPAARAADYRYDDFGNLTSVTPQLDGQAGPVERLTYDTADRPHAARARSVGGQPAVQYHYDDRGRLFEGGGRGITWTDFDLPRTVTQAGQTTTFLYDAFGARVKKTRVAPGKPTERTVTIGGLYERRSAGAAKEHRFFVYGDGEPVTEVVYREQGSTEETHLLGRDGHGSVGLVFSDDGSTVYERLYYEPFGVRTDVAGAPVGASATGVPWGFTGQHEDDDLGLIDMKGRVYDPVLRRFLSPDPIVHDVLVGQTLNHYSYVWNNPLRYVDPTGLDGDPAGAPEPAQSESGLDAWIDEIETWFGEIFAPKQTLYKVKPQGQILPGGSPPVTVQAGDVQADDGSAVKSTPSSARESKPVTSHGFSPGILGVHPFVATLAASVNSADSNLDHANKAAQAAAHGDAYHAADEVLQIAQDTAEAGGKVFIDAGRGALALPGDVNEVLEADTVQDRISAAGNVLDDVLGVAGGVGLALGVSREPTAGSSPSATAALADRAAQVHGVLDPIAAGQRTTAVLQTNGGNIIAGGARDLSPLQRSMLAPGEIAAKLPGAHAEVTAITHAAKAGLAPRALAVTRAFCPECIGAIQEAGGQITSPTTAVWP